MEQPHQPEVSPTGEPNPDEVLRRKPKTLQIVLIVVTVLTVLCCGGVAIAGVIDGTKNKTPKPAASPSHSSPPPAVFTTPSVAASATVATSSPGPLSPVPASSAAASRPAVLPPAQPTTHAATTPAPPPAAPTTVVTQHGVHPGAFCSPAGALGLTTDGVLMRCGPSTTDSRNRWRAA